MTAMLTSGKWMEETEEEPRSGTSDARQPAGPASANAATPAQPRGRPCPMLMRSPGQVRSLSCRDPAGRLFPPGLLSRRSDAKQAAFSPREGVKTHRETTKPSPFLHRMEKWELHTAKTLS